MQAGCDPIVAYIWFTHRVQRAVYQQPDGRQYVLDDEGEKIYGVWYIPPEERTGPDIIVEK